MAPTATAPQLDATTVIQHFDRLTAAGVLTVEGGRPDFALHSALMVLRAFGTSLGGALVQIPLTNPDTGETFTLTVDVDADMVARISEDA